MQAVEMTSADGSMMAPVSLAWRTVIRAQGERAAEFLQGALTCDVRALKEGGALFGALLFPQGKIAADVMLFLVGGEYYLDVPRDREDETLGRLKLYATGRKITLTHLSDCVIYASGHDGRLSEADSAFAVFPDPRSSKLGFRAYFLKGGGGVGAGDPAAYHAARMRAGVPEAGIDYASNERYPLDLELDELGGVSFTKGCYAGQEVTSRMHSRAAKRKRLVRVLAENGMVFSAEDAGAALKRTDDGGAVGEMLGFQGNAGLAVVSAEAAGGTLRTASGGIVRTELVFAGDSESASDTPVSRELKVKRLIYRSLYRGCKETDFLFGKLLGLQPETFADEELALYEMLLDAPDPDVYAWLTEAAPFPPAFGERFPARVLGFLRAEA